MCSSTQPGATVSRPQLTASQTRAGGEGASMDLAGKYLFFLLLCVATCCYTAVCVNTYCLAGGASACV